MANGKAKLTGEKGFSPLHTSKSLTLKIQMKMSDCCCPVSCCFVVLPVIVSFEVGKYSNRQITLHCRRPAFYRLAICHAHLECTQWLPRRLYHSCIVKEQPIIEFFWNINWKYWWKHTRGEKLTTGLPSHHCPVCTVTDSVMSIRESLRLGKTLHTAVPQSSGSVAILIQSPF